jgi:anionic cell wall polymer biosynthesis LytR-Cps2A-Psr (LCP) family protein
MSRNRILILVVVGVVILFSCICAVGIGVALWNSPLAPALTYPTEPVLPAGAQIGLPPSNLTLPPEPIATPLIPAKLETNCGNTGSTNILVMGLDAPRGIGINGPLAIRIAKIDFSNKSFAAFSFPRDMWIPISGLESLGFSEARLGESYLIARANGGLSAAAATNILAQNLNKNFGAVSNHYVIVKLSSFVAMIDAVGGILVNIPVDYDGTPFGFHYFQAGPYLMSGALAMEYATAPSTSAQWSGMDRQTLILRAFEKKMSSPEIIPQVPTLLNQFLQMVTTDLSLQQIMDLICISQQIPDSRITSSGVGPEDVTSGASGVLYPKFDVIRSKVKLTIG